MNDAQKYDVDLFNLQNFCADLACHLSLLFKLEVFIYMYHIIRFLRFLSPLLFKSMTTYILGILEHYSFHKLSI